MVNHTHAEGQPCIRRRTGISEPRREMRSIPFLKVCLGPAPVGVKEAVHTVPRDQHRLHRRADRMRPPSEARATGCELGDLREIVAYEPVPRQLGVVPLKDHDAFRHTPQLSQATDRVAPVMV